MKRLTCEICGSTDLIKQDGIFVCQACGCQYTLEEAKKLMIDGVVEVTGTVKVDNTDRIEKMLVNAKRAYTDQKWSEAEALFGQILNEDPENAIAILYQGLAHGWQGNTVRYYMDQAGVAAERAIEIAHEQMKDGDQFASFAKEAVGNIDSLAQALASLCLDNINSAADRFNREISIMRANTSIYSDHASLIRRTNEAEASMNRTVNNNYAIIDKTFCAELSVIEKALRCMSKVDVYDRALFEGFRKPVVGLDSLKGGIKNNTFSRKTASLTRLINDYLREKTDIEKREQQKRADAYWAEHKEEKEKLNAELSELKDKRSKAKQEYSNKKSMFDKRATEIRREESAAVPAETEAKQLEEKIKNLIADKKKLGIFKLKEMRNIDNQIVEAQNRIKELSAIKKSQKEKQKIDSAKKLRQLEAEFDLDSLDRKIKQLDNDINLVEKRLRRE